MWKWDMKILRMTSLFLLLGLAYCGKDPSNSKEQKENKKEETENKGPNNEDPNPPHSPKMVKINDEDYIIRDVPGDGHCFFHAVRFYEDQEIFALREAAAMYAIANDDVLRPLYEADLDQAQKQQI